MTEKEEKELDKAIKELKKVYKESLKSDYIKQPLAHALYTTWKKFDRRK